MQPPTFHRRWFLSDFYCCGNTDGCKPSTWLRAVYGGERTRKQQDTARLDVRGYCPGAAGCSTPTNAVVRDSVNRGQIRHQVSASSRKPSVCRTNYRVTVEETENARKVAVGGDVPCG
ncbi:hypothetical protein O3P69_003176 [Scylla paramamosain]|uniref:Uncharacterized protein n=1 Tax=Scylla paramamosain TaxID=85552 RepID=A0AAW0UNS3_SCYPA